MKKVEFLKNVVELAGERDIVLSQKTVNEILNVMEEVIEDVIKAEDEVVIMGTKFGTKTQAARQGVAKMKEGEETAWSTPEMIVPFAKIMKSKKDALSKEI